MNVFYSFRTQCGMVDALFQAVLSGDKLKVNELRANGRTLTYMVKLTLVNGGGGMLCTDPISQLWNYYLADLEHIGAEDFIYISRVFREEAGKPLYYSDTVGHAIGGFFYNTEVFICLTECYDLKRLKKKQTLQEIIRQNKTELLAVCENLGWLKNTTTRDELIEYASKKGKVECTAWLLDFKNRTADLAAERAKAEKRAELELNADPNSVTELRKSWNYEKQEDGTIIITGYKGSQNIVTVPGRIGKDPVTAIGEYAFSPNAPRLTHDKELLRAQIEKIAVPASVRTIGRFAFGGYTYDHKTWRHIDSLPEVVLPRTLDIFGSRQAAEEGANIFNVSVGGITAVIPHLENAEYYCKKNGIPYSFEEDK